MSTFDHARANFQTLLRAAADGNLATELANDTDLLADERPADSAIALSSVRAARVNSNLVF
jgi:hypothetical protein